MKAVPRLVFVALVVASLSASPAADGQSSGRNEFSDVVEVVTIEVPVQVLRDGKPVRGLTAADFEVLDGRKSQRIVGFDVIDLSAAGDAARGGSKSIRGLPIAARRHFLFLFDFSFSEPSAISRARKAAQELVASQLHPTDLVAVATYSIQRGPELLLGFTSDRQQVAIALDTLGLPTQLERFSDPLAFVISDPRGDLSKSSVLTSGGDLSPTASAGGDRFAAQLGDYAIGFARNDLAVAQGQVLGLTRHLEDFAKMMSNVEGRKQVVYLSEGFDSQILTGTTDLGQIRQTNEAAATGQVWRIDSEERYGSTGTLSALESMLEEFRRADAVIQAVDIGGLRAGRDAGRESSSGQNSLFTMARETGGQLYRNWNNLSGAMNELLEDTSVTYLLSFQPTGLKANGDFHKLRVRLKNQPRGTEVVHRPGYYAPEPFASKSALERRLEAAERILAGVDSGSIASAIVAAPFGTPGANAYVPVLIEIDGPSLLEAQTGQNKLALEVYAYAIDADGTVQDFFSQMMELDLEKARPALEASGVKLFGDLTLPPGDYLLRTLVRDMRTGRSSARSLPLGVPELSGGRPMLAMPLFPEAGGKWLMVQEASGSAARQALPYPFQLQGNPYMPAARPDIPAGTEARFVLLGYNLGSEGIPLETRLVTAAGETVEGSRNAFVGRDEGVNPAATQLVLNLETEGLAAGDYRLVASLQGQETSTSTPFRVVAN